MDHDGPEARADVDQVPAAEERKEAPKALTVCGWTGRRDAPFSSFCWVVNPAVPHRA